MTFSRTLALLSSLALMAGLPANAAETPDSLPITVHIPAGAASPLPVTGGVPLPEGAAPVGSALTLRDAAGKAVPLQTEVLSRWPGDSARWLLLDFQTPPDSLETLSYTLHWATASEAEGASAPDSTVAVTPADKGLVTLDGRADVAFTLTLGDGTVCQSRVEEALTTEVSGPLRFTHNLRGAFYTPAGARQFQFRLRISTFAGSSLVRLEPLVLIDAAEGVMHPIRDLRLSLTPHATPEHGELGGAPGWAGTASEAARLFQRDDRFYAIEHAGVEEAAATGEKAPGWCSVASENGQTLAVAMRDFWQQWPKDLTVSKAGIGVGLFPRFAPGSFDHMEPWYKYQYLFEDGAYRIRTGQARRWEVWVDLAGDGARLAALADAPPVVAPEPATALATGVWGSIAPEGAPGMAAYDAWAENLFDAYQQAIAGQRDYGAMNWGDWFGERQVNWGNLEYDTTEQIVRQFARTGAPKYHYAAETAAHHYAEVDTVHHVNDDLADLFGRHANFPARPGLVHQHTVGHVSGFYPNETIRALFVERNIGNSPTPYLCVDPYNLGHIWTQGMAHAYFVTGNPFLRETVERIGDNLAQLVEDNEYNLMGHSHCGRTTGWTLIALSGAYEIDRNSRYLGAMQELVDRALAAQDPVCGGWLYELPAGHCNCKTRKHVGMAGFITAVLVNGLAECYALTGDERLPKAIHQAVTYLNNETWRETWNDWRYTPCPASGPTSQPGVVMLAHVHAVRIAESAEALRILDKAWGPRFERFLGGDLGGHGPGKVFSSKMLGSPEAAGLLATRGLLVPNDCPFTKSEAGKRP
jgi:hypothetical protein